MHTPTPYRLGLDLGTNSIGWTMLQLSPEGRPIKIVRMGSRIFSDGRDPKSGQSLAADRTSVRSQRTRRDRAVQRRNTLLRQLCALGLLPQDPESAKNLLLLNPYELRAKALAQSLHPHHLGRALMHLAKRRGFQSNRRTPDKDEEGNTKEAARHLQEMLGDKTLGQFLHERANQGLGTRFCPKPESAAKPKKDFEFYPLRAMYADEFAKIRVAQSPHQKLKPEDWAAIERLIFFQRPLRTPQRGMCRFLPSESRADLALPSFQQFRILSDANHLGYRSDPFSPVNPLTPEQRDIVVQLLRTQQTVAFGKLRTKLNLPDTARFNLESDRREKLVGDPVGCLFAGKTLFGKGWHDLSLEKRDEIVTVVLETEDHESLRKKGESFGLSGDALDAFVEFNPDKLPKGTARFSAIALRKLVPELEKGLKYSDAVAACGWQHTQAAEDGSQPSLPYYGKAMPDSVVPAPKSQVADEKTFGRFPNPTVHIALNQLRLVVNTLIARFGKPMEIHLEIARDLKMSAKQRAELERQQTANTKANRTRDEDIDKINAEQGAFILKNYDNRLRLRLWEELCHNDVNSRCCPYTGQRITRAILFSDQVEIDHILPFALTLDDSPANKVLCMRSANRAKQKRSPFEAFGRDQDTYAEILNRAALLPGNKRWRFQSDALTKFRDEQRFLARQLVDTQHLGRAAHRYLTCIVPPNLVRVSPGRVTALLRHHLGLETLLTPDDAPDRIGKNRADHRHHAIDALVIALIDPRFLKFVRDANAASELDRIEISPPWDSFRADAKAAVDAIVVSHRPDHNPAGRLHEETAYGEVLQATERRRPNQLWEIEKGFNLVVRKPVSGLKTADLERIRDHGVRRKLAGFLDSVGEGDKTKWAEALANFTSETGTRTVRLLIKNKSARKVKHGDGRFARWLIPGDVHSVTFWRTPDGKIATTALTVWEANARNSPQPRPHPAARKLFSVCKGDALKTVHKGAEKTVRIFSIRPSQGNELLACCPIEAANASDDQVFIRFNRLMITQTRLVYISPIGELRDPGPSQPPAP